MTRMLMLAAALLMMLMPPPLAAQQIIQSGKPVPGHAGRWVTNLTLGDAGVANGGPPGTGLTELNITSTLNNGAPLCINDAPITGPYHQLCLGSGGGQYTISANGFGGATAQGLVLNINGTNYGFPSGGAGTGNVIGPGTSVVSEIASYNNATGTLLRQGAPAQISPYPPLTAAIGGTGYAPTLLATTNPAFSPQDMLNATCNNCGYTEYDSMAGMAIATLGSTKVNVAGVAGYVKNQNPGTSASQNVVALFGTVLSEVNNAQSWGVNTICMDSATYVLGTGTGRLCVGAEFDFNVMNPGTTLTGVLVTGSSLSQPTKAAGFAVASLQHGTVVAQPFHWITGFQTGDGAAVTALYAGMAAASGGSVNSQPVNFGFTTSSGVANLLSLEAVGGDNPTLALLGSAGSGAANLSIGGSFVVAYPATSEIPVGGASFVSSAGINTYALIAGAKATTGSNIASQSVNFNYRDATGTVQTMTLGTVAAAPASLTLTTSAAASPVLSTGLFQVVPVTWTDVQPCAAGQITADNSYIYVCTAANVVKRVALTVF